MISIIETGALLNPDMTPMNSASATLVGLSTDSKPTNAGNGWIFSEIDTGKIYIFDAENSTWREWSSGGGGGGGGGSGGDSLKITFDENGVSDTTWQQASNALAAGKRVYNINADAESGFVEQGIWLTAYPMEGEAYYLYGLYGGDPIGSQVCQADTADGYLYFSND